MRHCTASINILWFHIGLVHGTFCSTSCYIHSAVLPTMYVHSALLPATYILYVPWYICCTSCYILLYFLWSTTVPFKQYVNCVQNATHVEKVHFSFTLWDCLNKPIVYTLIYIHTYVRPYIRTCVCTPLYTYIRMYAPIYVHTYVCTPLYTYIRMYTPIYIHTYVCTPLYTYVHTSVHPYIHTYVCTPLYTYIRM